MHNKENQGKPINTLRQLVPTNTVPYLLQGFGVLAPCNDGIVFSYHTGTNACAATAGCGNGWHVAVVFLL